MIAYLLIFYACQNESIKAVIEDTAALEDSGIFDTGADTGLEETEGPRFVLLEQHADGVRLMLREEENWNTGQQLAEASSNSILRHKDGFIWLFNRESAESIVQYDPADFTQPKAIHQFAADAQLMPNDVTICGDYVFATLYDGTDLLVLNRENLQQEGRIPLESYADDDGLPEASTLVCKKNQVYVSLHRLNRDEDPVEPQQMGSLWLVFDPASWEEVVRFDDQGFRSDIYDVEGTQYLGSVIRPHIDVVGTTGFWIFDPMAEWYTSQIYFAWNDKTIFDTGIGTEKAIHLATNYADDMTWLFCHDFTPGEDQPGYSYEELVPNSHAFVSITMNENDEAWMSFQTLGANPQFSMMSLDTERCMSNNDERTIDHQILDWEILP